MESFECANCETITEFEKRPKKFLCPVCGVLNTPKSEDSGTGKNACGCLLPTGFEWTLPAGVVETPNGTFYASPDDGTLLSFDEWVAAFGSDPAKAKAWMKKMGEEGKEGFVNLSTLKNKKSKPKAVKIGRV